MKKNVFTFAAALLVLAGCAREMAEKFETVSPNTTISAVVDDAVTKAALSDAGKFTWQEGDKISVYTSKGVFKEFTLSEGAGTNKAKFSGSLDEGETVKETAVYPSTLSPLYVSASEIKVTFPESFTYEGENTRVPMIAALDAKSGVLTFKQNGGVIKFSLTGIPEDAAKLVVKSDLGITGTFSTAPFKTGQYVPLVATDETTSVTVNFTRTGDAMNFYIPVPVGVMHALSCSLQKADGSVISEKITSQENVIGIGTLLLMPVVATVTEGNIATAEEFISFLSSTSESDTKSYRLVNDIDLSGKAFTPATGFGGVLNGQGHVVKVAAQTPVFQAVSGTVKNLMFSGSFSANGDGKAALFAPIAALAGTGKLVRVFTDASVTYLLEDGTEPVLVAGLVAFSQGTLTGCVNMGDVSLTSAKGLVGGGVAGIAGYQKGAIAECGNFGNVTSSSLYTSGKAKAVEGVEWTAALAPANAALPSAAGVVAFGGEGFSMSKCENAGAVTFTQTQIENFPTKGVTNMNRHQVAGIVANPWGNVEFCTNHGKVTASVKTSDGSAMSGSKCEYIFCVGGIAGGDYFATGQNVTSLKGCSNTGTVTLDSDAAQSNSVLAGIIGWPGVEGTQASKTEDCINEGDVILKGTVKARVGGVQGGTGHMYGCTNRGFVQVESANAASVAGLLCGFHSQGHKIENCAAEGTLLASVKLNGVGGLIGNIGNAAHTTGAGCSVSASIICSEDTANKGMVIGYYNGVTKTITLGTDESPISVMGILNETEVTAENYTTLLAGPANEAEVHVIKAVFGKGSNFVEHLSSGYFVYDGLQYPVVKLADGKWWMAAPLNYVPAGKMPSEDPKTESGIWYAEGFDADGNPAGNSSLEGLLYDCSTAFGAEVTYENYASFEGVQGICPPGWYIPTRADYLALVGNSNKAVGESAGIDDPTAKYYVTGYKGSNVTAFNGAGWNFSFLGVRTKASESAEGAYNKNRTGVTNFADPRYLGKPAMNCVMTSTAYQPNPAGTNIQFFDLMTTFTDAYPQGRLMLSYAGYKYGMEVRCVRKATE